MPQMAPLFWLNLFIFFTLIYILFLILNYFISVPSTQQMTSDQQVPTKLNWKW
uniref:ATP synthase complex subunit 8 n=1 Tax=Neocaridina denticulata sinensis TaxID=274643 RepID=A0A8K1X4C2_NEODE|nr:ATP synthase F0 subunit 8 [Neocaridina denticulata sinensis]